MNLIDHLMPYIGAYCNHYNIKWDIYEDNIIFNPPNATWWRGLRIKRLEDAWKEREHVEDVFNLIASRVGLNESEV